MNDYVMVFNDDLDEDDQDFYIALKYDSTEGRKEPEDRFANAAQLLLRVTNYLRRGKPVPTVLAIIVGNAFEKAAKEVPEKRAATLARNLGLSHSNRPRKHHPALVLGAVLKYIRTGKSETKAVKAAAAELAMSQSGVWEHWRTYRDATHKRLGFLPWADKRKPSD